MNRSVAMFLDDLDRRDEERRTIKTLKHPQDDEEKALEKPVQIEQNPNE